MIKDNEEMYQKARKIWNLKKRICYSEKSDRYKYYGERGIIMSDEWKNSFYAFYSWFLQTYEKGKTLDRRDNDKEYSANNCRWTSAAIQAQNTRKIRSSNTSGYRGVCFLKNSNKWESRIGINMKRIFLGAFNTALEAAIAREKYIIKNNLNHTLNNVDIN